MLKRKIRKLSKSTNKGATLIELGMVILIVAVLATVAIAIYYDMQEDAENAVVEGVKGALNGALVIYHIKNQGEGPTCPQLVSEIYKSSDVTVSCS